MRHCACVAVHVWQGVSLENLHAAREGTHGRGRQYTPKEDEEPVPLSPVRAKEECGREDLKQGTQENVSL